MRDLPDLLGLPPERLLPDPVRARARDRIVAGMILARNPARRWAPAAVAATVAAAAVGGLVITGSGPAPRSVPPGTGAPNTDDSWEYTPQELYNVHEGTVPEDQIRRCGAQEWQPILTAATKGVTVAAFRAPGGVVFCEQTPATVRVAKPAGGTADGTARATYVSSLGTIAGLIDPAFRSVSAGPGDQWGMPGLAFGGVFVVPNGVAIGDNGVTVQIGGTPVKQGRLVRVGADAIPARVPAATDRPTPAGDRASEGGRLLGECLTHPDAGTSPAVDPDQWQPTQTQVLTTSETLQVGRYGSLLAECIIKGTSRRLQVFDQTFDKLFVSFEVQPNPFFISGMMPYDFRPYRGSYSSETGVIAGLVTDPRVTSVSLSRPVSPAVTAQVHNGTFVLPGLNVNEAANPVHPPSELTVYDKAGAVLTRVPVND
ncbi:hypothetical protein ABZU76_14725 [Amycolatopsis sp. NPDC005232]|uniref:hypothetical protein n=1 Tax=Amycolatopsis sp. NPDC005232 TaxID=3157027 RepID=UPI0033B5D052